MARQCVGTEDNGTSVKTIEGQDTVITSDDEATIIVSKSTGKVTIIQEDKLPTHLVDGAIKSKISSDLIPEAIQIIDPGLPGNLPQGNDKTFIFTQGVASNFWEVPHYLGKMVSVTVVDTGGTTVEGDVAHIDSNRITIEFNAPFTGQAFCN